MCFYNDVEISIRVGLGIIEFGCIVNFDSDMELLRKEGWEISVFLVIDRKLMMHWMLMVLQLWSAG